MDSELLKRIRALAENDEGISGEGTRRLLAAYDALVADAQLQAAANDLNREDLEELQNRMAAAEAKLEEVDAALWPDGDRPTGYEPDRILRIRAMHHLLKKNAALANDRGDQRRGEN